jgi:hypothetical protein
MDGNCGTASPVNSFSVVAYLPEPLGGFFDQIRRDLVPGCVARTHVTVLPPRPLDCPWPQAWEELRQRVQGFAPFRVSLNDVGVFDGSHVLHLTITSRRSELEQLNALTNTGHLHCVSNFRYQPHITLAQGLAVDKLAEGRRRAETAWAAYGGPRYFVLGDLALVQNTAEDRWIDLANLTLGSPVSA